MQPCLIYHLVSNLVFSLDLGPEFTCVFSGTTLQLMRLRPHACEISETLGIALRWCKGHLISIDPLKDWGVQLALSRALPYR